MRAAKLCLTVAAALMLSAGCTSDVVENYTIDYDFARGNAYPNEPAPYGALERMTSGPYQGDEDAQDSTDGDGLLTEAEAQGGDTADGPSGGLKGDEYLEDRSFEALRNADQNNREEITARAYERAREITQWPDTPAKPPEPVGMEKSMHEINDGPYKATSQPYRVYPYYRPYDLPTYWPSYRYHRPGSGFRGGVGVWVHN